MSKILVPKELEEQIVDLYVNKNYSRKDIREGIPTPFGDSVILRILKEHDVEIRSNPGAKKGGRKKDKVSEDIRKSIVDKYNEGYGAESIAKLLNINYSFDKIKRILIEEGITPRDVKASTQVKIMPDLRKYQINDDYDFVSHNGAWILGFIASDGYLPKTRGAKNRVVITLARKDEDVLYKIAEELSYTGPIVQYEANGFPCSSLNFCSKSLRQKIEGFGIVNNKTFKLHHLPSNLPDEFMIDYIRGYFDGDGSVYEPKGKKINMSLISVNKTFLQDIALFLNKHYGLKIPIINYQDRGSGIYEIRYYTKDSFILGKLFYNNDYLALPRKKQHFLDILIKNNSHEPKASHKDEKIC